MAADVVVKKIIYGGWGLTHYEGKTLLLPFTAPGDRVEFTVVRQKKNCLFGHVTRVTEPSPMRREPQCPVFGLCGGCHLLHLSYEDELTIKKAALLESLEMIGKIRTGLDGTIPSPSRLGYRNHCLMRTDANGDPGFYRRESTTVVPFPPQGCLLLPETVREQMADIPRESFPAPGDVRVRLDKDGTTHFWGLSDREGPPDILMQAGEYIYPISPGAFFQTNTGANEKLQDLVVSLADGGERRLIDLYCGAGFFTLPLARRVDRAIGIESNRTLSRCAAAAARLNKISNVRFVAGSVEREIRKIRDADLILADPPRTGITEEALRGIVKLRPRGIIIVSCEPPTFARDAAKLIKAGYLPKQIFLVDLFPGTYHVETVARFSRS